MIYLDNNSTTKVDERVLKEMIPFFSELYGNPSSVNNAFCKVAERRIEKTKSILRAFFNSKSNNDFIFTSGATESNNMVIKGIASHFHERKGHIIVSNIEHKSVISTCNELSKQGYDIEYVNADQEGIIHPEDIEKRIKKNTILLIIMAANNELGTIQEIVSIGEIARKHNILFFSDMTQYIASHACDVQKVNVDLISFSAHKIYGPKGVGGLYANEKARDMMVPLLYGGNQQLGLRAGTLNVPGIIGLGSAVELLDKERKTYNSNILFLRERFLKKIESQGIEKINGNQYQCIPGTLNITFKNIYSIELMQKCPDLVFSTGSACLEGSSSYVLDAIGLNEDQIKRTARFGIGKYNTVSEVDIVTQRINEMISLKNRRI